MKQNSEIKPRQVYGEAKIEISEELEKKLKTIKVSPVKTEKAIQATKNLDFGKIMMMRSAK